jgi:hypothetical protein
MNQKNDATQAPNGPLTWIWYLVVFALMATRGANMAVAVLGHGAFQVLVGTMVGLLVAGGIAWLWRRIPSLIARLILGSVILVVTAVSALVAQALLESRNDVAVVATIDRRENDAVDSGQALIPATQEEGRFTQLIQPKTPAGRERYEALIHDPEWHSMYGEWEALNVSRLDTIDEQSRLLIAVNFAVDRYPTATTSQILWEIDCLILEKGATNNGCSLPSY